MGGSVGDAVNAFLDRERAIAPDGVSFTLTRDMSSIVKDRLRLLAKNGLQGLVLVFLVMWLFFRLRFAFWVAMGLPVAFLGGLFLMSVVGLTINMISMVALLIALGLLMDDAIVIAENIATRIRLAVAEHNGEAAVGGQAMPSAQLYIRAAIDGTRQVAPGVISSFLTTVAVFGPLAFLAGDMGKVLRVLPMVLILVLAVSLVEAFCILPNHLGHALAGSKPSRAARFRARFEAAVNHVREIWVGTAVDWVVGRRYLFLGGVVALMLISVAFHETAKV